MTRPLSDILILILPVERSKLSSHELVVRNRICRKYPSAVREVESVILEPHALAPDRHVTLRERERGGGGRREVREGEGRERGGGGERSEREGVEREG